MLSPSYEFINYRTVLYGNLTKSIRTVLYGNFTKCVRTAAFYMLATLLVPNVSTVTRRTVSTHAFLYHNIIFFLPNQHLKCCFFFTNCFLLAQIADYLIIILLLCAIRAIYYTYCSSIYFKSCCANRHIIII